MTTTEPHIVNVKVLNTTRDFLQKCKKPLNAKNIDDVIQLYIGLSLQTCFLVSVDDPTTMIVGHPCDTPFGMPEAKFDYRGCPANCQSKDDVKLTRWWSEVTSFYGFRTKKGYVEMHLRNHRKGEAEHDAEMVRLDEMHRNDPNWKAGDFDYDYAHRPYKTPPTRELLESDFKRYVEEKKECVLRMEKLRKQTLLAEWKKLWNYPACIEGIIEVAEPEDAEALASPQA